MGFEGRAFIVGSRREPGEVADFIMLVAGIPQPADERVVHLPVKFVINLPDLPGPEKAVERRPLLVHEAVGGDMLDIQFEQAVNVLVPLFERLVRKAEHQVHGDVSDAGLPQAADRRPHLLCRMPAMEELQAAVRESLRPHGDAVDRQRVQAAGEGHGHIVGIALHGDLHGSGGSAAAVPPAPPVLRAVHPPDCPEQLLKARERKLRGRAPAQIDAGQLRRVSAVPAAFPQFHFMAESIHIPLFDRACPAPFGRDGRIKAAVDAAAGTERDVYVKSCHDAGDTYIYNM